MGFHKSFPDVAASTQLAQSGGFDGVLAAVQRKLVEKKRWLTQEEFVRGMGAVAAGLIAAAGLKVLGSLKTNVWGLRICAALAERRTV